MGKITQHQTPTIYTSNTKLPQNVKIIEAYERSVEEYFYVKNPHIKKGSHKNIKNIIQEFKIDHIWIYYPWLNTAVHTVTEDVYYTLRTARNRNVITEKEQQNFRNLKLGIVGLSVGSNALSSLVYLGGPKYYRIADFDSIEITNLNRIQANLLDVGENKAVVAAHRTWEIDPFAQIDIWDKGIRLENLEKFIAEDKLDFFVDTMDNLFLKIKAREICRKNKIPVLMITENGDSTILDIERYDLEPMRPLFHGRIQEGDFENAHKFTQKEWLSLAVKIVDASLLTEEMQDSILVLGKDIAGVPQIATSVSIGASALAFAVRRISNGYLMPSGRYKVSLEDQLIPNYKTTKEKLWREKKTKKFLSFFPSLNDS